MQADSDERYEIDLQTELIDLKQIDPKYIVDVYDLGPDQRAKKQKSSKIGIKETREAKIGTDPKQDMLSAKDWYFSDLHRHLLFGYYQKFRKQVPQQVQEDFD